MAVGVRYYFVQQFFAPSLMRRIVSNFKITNTCVRVFIHFYSYMYVLKFLLTFMVKSLHVVYCSLIGNTFLSLHFYCRMCDIAAIQSRNAELPFCRSVTEPRIHKTMTLPKRKFSLSIDNECFRLTYKIKTSLSIMLGAQRGSVTGWQRGLKGAQLQQRESVTARERGSERAQEQGNVAATSERVSQQGSITEWEHSSEGVLQQRSILAKEHSSTGAQQKRSAVARELSSEGSYYNGSECINQGTLKFFTSVPRQ